MPASLSLALLKPQLLNELNGLLFTGRASLEAKRQALFSGPVAADRLGRYCRLMQPESPRAIWDMTFFDLPPPRHPSCRVTGCAIGPRSRTR